MLSHNRLFSEFALFHHQVNCFEVNFTLEAFVLSDKLVKSMNTYSEEFICCENEVCESAFDLALKKFYKKH
tara:strand:- start:226 stop:438 length:213 start_codon:yes stop_codon:yes gene_type:complete